MLQLLMLTDGKSVAYDKLCVCTGATPKVTLLWHSALALNIHMPMLAQCSCIALEAQMLHTYLNAAVHDLFAKQLPIKNKTCMINVCCGYLASQQNLQCKQQSLIRGTKTIM